MTLGEHLTMTASASIFHIAVDYKNNKYESSSHINIKQRILGVYATISRWKISGDLTQTFS